MLQSENLFENYSKNVVQELVPGACLFLKNPLQKVIRGSLVITYLQSMGQGQIGIKLGTKPFTYQKLANYTQEMDIYMLTGLKVSSLAYKYAKGEPHGIEF